MDNVLAMKANPMSEKTNLEDYSKAVEQLARDKSPFIFENSRLDCAAIITAMIFKFAKSKVRVYDRLLTGRISDAHPSLLKELGEYFSRGGHLSLLLGHEIESDSKAATYLSECLVQYPDQLEIRQANEDFTSNLNDLFPSGADFIVSDNNAIRVEQMDEFSHENHAICCFNSTSTATRLINIFDKNYSNCEKIELLAIA